jgi:hypothetical protein
MDYRRLLERAGLLLRERSSSEESTPLEIVTLEAAGRTPSAEQLAFRQRWLQ